MCSIDFDCVFNNPYKNNINMKAKEMPENIYIFDFNDAMVTPLEGDTVYVRKDAFIEKACQWIKENLLKHTYVCEGEVGIGMAVFLEEFKQAM